MVTRSRTGSKFEHGVELVHVLGGLEGIFYKGTGKQRPKPALGKYYEANPGTKLGISVQTFEVH